MFASSQLEPDLEIPQGPVATSIPVAFGTSVAISAIAFLGGFPALSLPGPLFLGLLLAAIFCGGWVAGRSHARGVRCSAAAGFGAGLITLLILGGLFLEDAIDSDRWVSFLQAAGFLILAASLASAGGALGVRKQKPVDPCHRFSLVAAVGTFLLVAVGGLVTSEEAGLAVPDWPTSFEANMFLLPLSRMVGGVFFEHAHRLFGALVGLATVSLALFLWRYDRRKSIKIISAVVSVQVVIQGIIGGYRVTLAENGETVGSLALRVFHGINAQFFLTLMAVLAVITSSQWKRLAPGPDEGRRSEWIIASLTLAAAILQLLLGALVRHIDRLWVMPHIVGAVIVIAMAIGCAVRATTLAKVCPSLSRNGVALLIAVSLQLILGFVSLAVTSTAQAREVSSGPLETLVVTSHQTLGALILVAVGCHIAWISGLFPLSGVPRGSARPKR